MSSTLFTGASRFSADFQQVITRAVNIASLPLKLMQTQKTELEAQAAELGQVEAKITALQSAIAGVGKATGSTSYSAIVADTTIASATVSSGASPASFTLEVTNLGSNNTTMSLDGLTKVTDPATGTLTSGTNFTINAGGAFVSFTAFNLNEMVSKINASKLDVQASVVNVGPSSAPDYRLSVQGTKLGALGISLTDDDAQPVATEMLQTSAVGAKAAYKVNGYATEATSDSRTVELAPGVTVNLLKKSATGDATPITVSRNSDSVKNALLAFASAYNTALGELDKNRGTGDGALSGQSIITSSSNILKQIQSYAPGSGTFGSLEDLGVTLDKEGHLSLNGTTFENAVTGKIDALMTFLGDTTTSGFLKAATDAIKGLEDPKTGLVSTAAAQTNSQIAAQEAKMAAEQDRIDQLQKSLEAQMAAADAMIASLEQQATYITQMFAAMDTASKSYN